MAESQGSERVRTASVKHRKKRQKKYRLKKAVRQKLMILAVLAAVITVILLVVPHFLKRQYSTDALEIKSANGIEIVHDYIPQGRQNRPEIEREIRWLVIHETDNAASSADAQHHNEYLKTNETDVNSWHYTVDDHSIYHALPDNEVGWHAGDKMTPNGGNMNGIGIELCVNEGNDYQKTLENAAALCAELLKTYHLKLEDIRQHHDFSGKDCPHRMLSANGTKEFLKMVKEAMKEVK